MSVRKGLLPFVFFWPPILVFVSDALAQDTQANHATAGLDILNGKSLEIFADSTCTVTLAQVSDLRFSSTAGIASFPQDRDVCYWLRAELSVPTDPADSSPRELVAEVGFHGFATLYLIDSSGLVETHEMGNDLPLNRRAYPHIFANANQNVAPLTVRPGRTYEILVRYANPMGASLYGTNDVLALRLGDGRAHDQSARLHLLLSGLMVGGLLLLLLYQAAQWTVYRTELDATYCLMLLGLLTFVCYDDYLFHAAFSDLVVRERWLYFTGSIGLLGFFRFAQLTLRTVDFRPSRDRLLGWLVLGKAIEAPVFLLIMSLEADGPPWVRQLAGIIPETFRITLIVTLLMFSYAAVSHFRANRDRATYAFVIGNLSLVLAVLVVTLRGYLTPFADFPPVSLYLSIITPGFAYIIEGGIVGMALCFAFAVALLTKEREALLERGFNRRLAEVRMETLRSQMNPHFLFNGLNSIKLFVIDNKPRLAGDYLSRFARLIRLVLENSKASLIPLSRELETLELYLRLESLRFGDRLSYTITVDPEIDGEFVYLPPTLLQPYVENAIWHGLLHRLDGEGRLRVEITNRPDGRLELVIEDNGVGRVYANQHRSATSTTHKSLGMQITADRIAMLRQHYGFEATVEVADLYHADGAAAGTRVTIYLTPGTRPMDEGDGAAAEGSAANVMRPPASLHL